MSLGGALSIGRSALLANQAAIEVAGNNLANVATKGYHRTAAIMDPVRSQEVQRGIFIGRGVQISQIVRYVDEALEGRLRNSVSDQSGSLALRDMLSQVEAIQNELSDNDLSSRLSDFFNAWSELANRPLDNSLRSLVVQQGATVAGYLRDMRATLGDLRQQTDQQIDQAARGADDILTRLAEVNQQVVLQERGEKGAHGLRDQRDALLAELAEYFDLSTVEQPNGGIDVYVGSLPILLNSRSRGLEIKRETVDGQLQIGLRISADGSELRPDSGRLGVLIDTRESVVNDAIAKLDDFTARLIYEVNKVHSQGQGTRGFDALTSLNRSIDPAATLDSEAAGLGFDVTHGSFIVHVTQKSTGQRTSTTIDIDLDGIDPANDTTLDSLAARLDTVTNLNASVTPDGRLSISADGSDFEITFSDDRSGALAALGVNTFFVGRDSRDIDVASTVSDNLNLLAAGRGHLSGDNSNALAMAALREQPIDALNGLTLAEKWNRHVEDIGTRLAQANSQYDADTIVRDNLEASRQAFSGVNSDEEAINLLVFQRAYQGSARFLSVVDEMVQTLLGLI